MTDERGQATILVVGMAMVVFAVAGLAVDATKAFIFRRSLQSAADAAALAGAGALDSGTYYASRGRTVRIDPARARVEARRWLRLRGLTAKADVTADRRGLTVVLRGKVDTTFLRLVGIGAVPVAVESSSRPMPFP